MTVALANWPAGICNYSPIVPLKYEFALAIAKAKPLSLSIYLFQHCQMLNLSINDREMKSESGFSIAMASWPSQNQMQMIDVHLVPITNFHFDAYV